MCFLINEKKNYSYNILFVSNRNLTTLNVKTVKNPRFFSNFCSKLQVFPGFVA